MKPSSERADKCRIMSQNAKFFTPHAQVSHLNTNVWPENGSMRQNAERSMFTGVSIRRLVPPHPAAGHRQQGLFATQRFAKFDILGEYSGVAQVIASADDYAIVSNEIRARILDDELLCIDAEDFGNEARYINSFVGIAESPNVTVRTAYIGSLPRGAIVCLRNIYVGEEMLLDYGDKKVPPNQRPEPAMSAEQEMGNQILPQTCDDITCWLSNFQLRCLRDVDSKQNEDNFSFFAPLGRCHYTSSNVWPDAALRAGAERAPMHGVAIRKLLPPHPVAGQYGLFATRPFAQFDVLGEYVGKVIRASWSAKDTTGEYVAYLEDGPMSKALGVDGEHCGNESRYINSFLGSASGPNVAMRHGHLDRVPRVIIVCLRRVEAGEEFLLDYGHPYTNHFILGGAPAAALVTIF
jgi:hypothetical protein